MTPDQAAAFVNAQAALLACEVAGYQAENKRREHRGESLAYDGEAFDRLFQSYEGVLGHNAALTLFQQANQR